MAMVVQVRTKKRVPATQYYLEFIFRTNISCLNTVDKQTIRFYFDIVIHNIINYYGCLKYYPNAFI